MFTLNQHRYHQTGGCSRLPTSHSTTFQCPYGSSSPLSLAQMYNTSASLGRPLDFFTCIPWGDYTLASPDWASLSARSKRASPKTLPYHLSQIPIHVAMEAARLRWSVYTLGPGLHGRTLRRGAVGSAPFQPAFTDLSSLIPCNQFIREALA